MFKCYLCDYKTNCRSQIHIHHIVPRELGGNNKKHNLISLCPNCHSKIYIPECEKGIHSIKNENSIILKRWVNNGIILEFINEWGDVDYL